MQGMKTSKKPIFTGETTDRSKYHSKKPFSITEHSQKLLIIVCFKKLSENNFAKEWSAIMRYDLQVGSNLLFTDCKHKNQQQP